MQFKVNIQKQDGFDATQAAKLEQARILWETVWNSAEFKNRILNFSYSYSSGSLWWKKWTTVKEFRWNNGKTNAQIYDTLMAGSETLQPGADNEADIQVTLYTASGSTVGYTYPTTVMQWINQKFFRGFTAADVVGNLTHEYCHKLGFDHEFKSTSLRPYTVPYAVGYISGELAEKIAA